MRIRDGDSSDPGSGMEKSRIRSATLAFTKVENYTGAGAMDHWRLYKENREPQFSL